MRERTNMAVRKAGLPRSLGAAALCIAVAVLGGAPAASARQSQGSAETGHAAAPSFLRGATSGSAAVYNPLVQVLNEGFDILQYSNVERRLSRIPFRSDAHNVLDNLTHPARGIRAFGAGDFLSHEILPMGFSKGSGQWIPNYTLHLVGGGIAHSMLTEWFAEQGVEHPWTWATTMFLTQSLLNEMSENNGRDGLNVDAVADVYVFNTAALALFSSSRVRRFFAETLNASVWGLQPSLSLRDGSLRNAGLYYAFKWRIPGTKRLYLFEQIGLGTLTGLSVGFEGGYHVTLAGGYRAHAEVVLDERRGLETVRKAPAGALFIDRDHSLLASVLVSGVPDERLHVNVYPGVVPGPWKPGIWGLVGEDGTVRVGVTAAFGIGAGF